MTVWEVERQQLERQAERMGLTVEQLTAAVESLRKAGLTVRLGNW